MNAEERYLTFALTKGRLANKTLDLLGKIGITCEEIYDKESRKLIFVNEDLKLRFFLSKGPDVPTYVEYGVADIGVVGNVILEFLSQDKFEACICASDIIVLPYKRIFDGASGPLGEGVAKNKMIIGANHGSLGQIIEMNHLGYTFESENVEELTRVLEKALSTEWKLDENYMAYKEILSTERFQKEYAELFKQLIMM